MRCWIARSSTRRRTSAGGPASDVGDDLTPNRVEPERLTAGITLVGKRARIPRDVEIGRNARIDPGVIERDFGGAVSVASGETVYAASAAS